MRHRGVDEIVALAEEQDPRLALWLSDLVEQHCEIRRDGCTLSDWRVGCVVVRGKVVVALVHHRCTGNLYFLPGSWRHTALVELLNSNLPEAANG